VRVLSKETLGNALLGAVRNHTPDVVVTDEIGGRDETQAVQLRGSGSNNSMAVAVWQCV
jgi:stage III sporulation protein SpoIIIAA